MTERGPIDSFDDLILETIFRHADPLVQSRLSAVSKRYRKVIRRFIRRLATSFERPWGDDLAENRRVCRDARITAYIHHPCVPTVDLDTALTAYGWFVVGGVLLRNFVGRDRASAPSRSGRAQRDRSDERGWDFIDSGWRRFVLNPHPSREHLRIFRLGFDIAAMPARCPDHRKVFVESLPDYAYHLGSSRAQRGPEPFGVAELALICADYGDVLLRNAHRVTFSLFDIHGLTEAESRTYGRVQPISWYLRTLTSRSHITDAELDAIVEYSCVSPAPFLSESLRSSSWRSSLEPGSDATVRALGVAGRLAVRYNIATLPTVAYTAMTRMAARPGPDDRKMLSAAIGNILLLSDYLAGYPHLIDRFVSGVRPAITADRPSGVIERSILTYAMQAMLPATRARGAPRRPNVLHRLIGEPGLIRQSMTRLLAYEEPPWMSMDEQKMLFGMALAIGPMSMTTVRPFDMRNAYYMGDEPGVWIPSWQLDVALEYLMTMLPDGVPIPTSEEVIDYVEARMATSRDGNARMLLATLLWGTPTRRAGADGAYALPMTFDDALAAADGRGAALRVAVDHEDLERFIAEYETTYWPHFHVVGR